MKLSDSYQPLCVSVLSQAPLTPRGSHGPEPGSWEELLLSPDEALFWSPPSRALRSQEVSKPSPGASSVRCSPSPPWASGAAAQGSLTGLHPLSGLPVPGSLETTPRPSRAKLGSVVQQCHLQPGTGEPALDTGGGREAHWEGLTCAKGTAPGRWVDAASGGPEGGPEGP